MVAAIEVCLAIHEITRSGAHVVISAGHSWRTLTPPGGATSQVTTYFVVSDFTHPLMMSTGSGNTMVVFFSTPISVSV